MIKILIADDSPTDAAILKLIFSAEADFQVVGWARNGKEAVELAASLQPDLITMDIKMPIMDGYQATDLIMRRTPTPIVIISSLMNDTEAVSEATYQALEAGALTVLPKPIDVQSQKFDISKRHMTDVIRSMAEIRPIRRRKMGLRQTLTATPTVAHNDYRLIVMGASVGGPQALKTILTRLSANFPVPIVVVQHMTQGFMQGFTKWLDGYVDINVRQVEAGELLLPGVVYFAPDHFHFEISSEPQGYVASMIKADPVAGFCPSITVLMQSAAKHCGKHTVGVLLTGMGRDGAEGMQALKERGAHTLVQDKESCVVFGMGNVANQIGAVDKVIALEEIADYLSMITKHHKLPRS